nr:hypothetical protein [Prevotella intermedia]
MINAFQNLLFRIVKEPLLHGKSGSFGVQNLRFCNAKSKLSFFFRIIFTKQQRFFHASANNSQWFPKEL